MAIARYCYREVLPFTAMVMVECSTVGLNTLFKAATLRGMSYYVFVFYSSVIATFVLLPFAFISYRRTMLPPIKFSVSSKFCLLGLLGFLAQISGFKGIEYSSPTLDSAISNLTPAFTFILAIFFSLEKLNLRSSSTLAKIIGTILSISGALLVVLYKGSAILGISQLSSPYHSLRLSVSNWAIGGLLLSAEYILISFWYIIQAQVMKAYPAELVSVFFYNLSATIISAPVCLLAETNLSAWRLTDNVALVATVYAGLFGSSFGTFVHTWGLHMKGPVYIALFKPLSIAIAAAMGIIFLGDTLYLGSVIGAVIISIGFYVAIWGKAKEENDEEVGTGNASSVARQRLPLLQEDMKGEEV